MGVILLAKPSKNTKKVEKLTLEQHEAQLEKEAKEPKKKKKKASKVSSGSISMYLAEIGRYDPLAPEKEVELAIRIQNNDENKFSSDDLVNNYIAEWSNQHEQILIEWGDKAICYRWLHSTSHNSYASKTRWFTIPVIIISTLTGTANFAQERVPPEYIPYYTIAVGATNIIAGIITTIQQFLKINELNESHRVASISWDKFYRNIKLELAKSRNERIHAYQMLKISKEEFDRLMETSPSINPKIIEKFYLTFSGGKIKEGQKPVSYTHLTLPTILLV